MVNGARPAVRPGATQPAEMVAETTVARKIDRRAPSRSSALLTQRPASQCFAAFCRLAFQRRQAPIAPALFGAVAV